MVAFDTHGAAEWAINNLNGKFLNSTGLPINVEWTYGKEASNQYSTDQSYRNHNNQMTNHSLNSNEEQFCGRHLSYSSDSSSEMHNPGFGNNYNNNYMLNNNFANSYSLQNGYSLNNSFSSNMFDSQMPNPRANALLRNMSVNNTSHNKISPTSSYYGQNSVYDSNNVVSDNNIWKS